MIDVSYRYKKGVWMMDEVTGEVHEVVSDPQPEPEPAPLLDTVIEGAVEERLTAKKPKG